MNRFGCWPRFGAVAVALICAVPMLAQKVETPRLTTPGNGPYGVPQATFFVHQLGTDHAEGITTLDMNGDGRPDILSGAYWYENPGPQGGDWKQHQFRKVGMVGEFVSDSGEWAIDVNHDGALDIVTTGWMLNGLWWYENPKRAGVLWEKHFITDSYDTEGGAIGDINGDGRMDLLEKDGWWEQPPSLAGDPVWKFHPFPFAPEHGSTQMYVYDVNGDGKNDVITALAAHGYGLAWFEQTNEGGVEGWTKHVIVGEKLYDADYIARHTTGFADLAKRVKEYPPERAAAPVQIIPIDPMPLTGVGKVFKPQLRWDAARRVFTAILAPLRDRGIDCSVKVGAHGSHGSIATVTLRVPEDQREAVANEVHTLLAPFVMRHEVVFG